MPSKSRIASNDFVYELFDKNYDQRVHPDNQPTAFMRVDTFDNCDDIEVIVNSYFHLRKHLTHNPKMQKTFNQFASENEQFSTSRLLKDFPLWFATLGSAQIVLLPNRKMDSKVDFSRDFSAYIYEKTKQPSKLLVAITLDDSKDRSPKFFDLPAKDLDSFLSPSIRLTCSKCQAEFDLQRFKDKYNLIRENSEEAQELTEFIEKQRAPQFALSHNQIALTPKFEVEIIASKIDLNTPDVLIVDSKLQCPICRDEILEAVI